MAVEAVKTLLRLFSYLFHGLLALFLIGASGLALASGAPSLELAMLPWTGTTLAWTVLGGGVLGLVSVILALFSKWRFVFLLWTLVVAVLLVRGYIFSGYRFQPGSVLIALFLTIGSLLAVMGAWSQLFRRRERLPRY